MGAACCSGDDSGEKIMSSEVKGVDDCDTEQDFPGMAMPAAALAPAMKASDGNESKTPPQLKVDFMLPDQTKKTVIFDRQPLGLDFNKTNPILMKRVQPGSHGDELGVKQGWQVIGVNGEDVSSKEFEYTYQILRKISTSLPNP
mmetsp:Transcript_17261/g.47780  ORF Transcript_17261/g.47780 Transcript_17261/m.47780 type:complete len:144 (+) Transcript_17261:100-531(+)